MIVHPPWQQADSALIIRRSPMTCLFPDLTGVLGPPGGHTVACRGECRSYIARLGAMTDLPFTEVNPPPPPSPTSHQPHPYLLRLPVSYPIQSCLLVAVWDLVGTPVLLLVANCVGIRSFCTLALNCEKTGRTRSRGLFSSSLYSSSYFDDCSPCYNRNG